MRLLENDLKGLWALPYVTFILVTIGLAMHECEYLNYNRMNYLL